VSAQFSEIYEIFGGAIYLGFCVEKQEVKEASFFSYLKSGGSNGSHTALGAFKYNVQVKSIYNISD
jgi:hypothetical protein